MKKISRLVSIWFLAIVLALVGAIIAGCGGKTEKPTPVEAENITPPVPQSILESTKILFRSDRTGQTGFYTMNPDGSDPQPLVFTGLPVDLKLEGIKYIPELKVFLMRMVDGKGWPDLYLTNAQGNILTRLTNSAADEDNVSYNPKTKQFVFVCAEPNLDICVVNLDGSQLAHLTDSPTNDLSPLWLQSGRVLFISSGTGVPALWLINADGTDRKPLNQINEAENSPALLPEGGKVVVAREHDKNWEIFLVDLNGGESVNLTQNPADDTDPALSPNGENVAFRSNRDGKGDVYVLKIQGMEVVRLTQSPDSIEDSYSWSPDSTVLYYSESDDGNFEIFSVKPDGSGKINLTNSPANDYGPMPIGY